MGIRDTPLRYFVGGVPPRSVYVNNAVGLLAITNRIPQGENGRQEWDICYIALVAYFEAFCKDLFACTVNILPELLGEFRRSGQETLVDAVDVASQGEMAGIRLGSLLSERIDLGTPKKINGAYRALLGCTPFGKDQARQFESILNVRNQIVHRGGIVTSKFARQTQQVIPAENVFVYSIVLNAHVFGDAYNLFMGVSGSMAHLAEQRIAKAAQESKLLLSDDQKKALEWMTRWEEAT